MYSLGYSSTPVSTKYYQKNITSGNIVTAYIKGKIKSNENHAHQQTIAYHIYQHGDDKLKLFWLDLVDCLAIDTRKYKMG